MDHIFLQTQRTKLLQLQSHRQSLDTSHLTYVEFLWIYQLSYEYTGGCLVHLYAYISAFVCSKQVSQELLAFYISFAYNSQTELRI